MTAEYKRQTEHVHQVNLTSSITRMHWLKKESPIGFEVKFELETDKVADNTPVIFEIKDTYGNVSEVINAKVRKNKYEGRFKTPEDAEDKLTITAKIKEYGLEGKSKDLLVLRDIEVRISDEYQDKLESHQTFDGIPFLLTTDTDKHYQGKAEKNKIIVKNVHYKEGFKIILEPMACGEENQG